MTICNFTVGILSVSLMLPFAITAKAQQPTPPDPQEVAMGQMIVDAAQREMAARAATIAAQTRIAALEAENAKLKETAKPTAPEAPK